MPSTIAPGLIALHGNRTETLADTVLAWLQAHPLGPLESEVVLVQSNGMAEWFKMTMAQSHGVCAAAQVELPARFLWRTYRQVLGKQAVPRYSPLDKLPLTWRLMRLLPTRLSDPAFAPIARFLRPGEPERLLQLAGRLADLFDQYQIYRADWLNAWQAGGDALVQPGGPEQPLPEGQLWQPALWRAVLADLTEEERVVTRTALRDAVCQALDAAEPGSLPVARRLVVFGLSHVPLSLLQFLAALSRHTQVVLAVPNPCRFHWADAIDGRELLRIERRRQPLRKGRDLSALPLQAMHAHAHPLLSAWGRQSRDYVRQLDAFDTTRETAGAQWPRIDLFDEDAADTGSLLEQVQRSIRDMLPLAEHPRALQPTHRIGASDRSIVFHSAHSLVRELEVLHDQLLQQLAQPASPDQGALQPREVVVMVPDVQVAAPAIRAVFGQYARTDPRHIPFDIADLSARLSSPLVMALQWLLRLPQQRCRLSELCDLLDVPAVSARFGLKPEQVPQLTHWMAGAGIRWGLTQEQRGSLGLAACGDHNSAWFGLRRMLLGYASGSQTVALDGRVRAVAAFDGIEPYDEVGGLDAELAGVLAAVLERLLRWWQEGLQDAVPRVWAERLRALAADLFSAQDDADKAVMDALDTALATWQAACEQAQFEVLVPLVVAQEAWLTALDQPALNQRFRAGGVTFCTLMPMRAIPFEVVCLLGMNDGDYPRRAARSDFDLMQQPGQYRPGDRARRDDDRQLMLEALLAARRTLYISWAGHHVRDNSEQPPSVLVSQLRDYLAAGWCGDEDLLAERTAQHPLQPFSRSYFEADTPLLTHAIEWRAAHASSEAQAAATVPPMPRFEPDPKLPLTVRRLAAFLAHPARAFFRERLSVHFDTDDSTLEDDEVFHLQGLQAYQTVQQLQSEVSADWISLQEGGRVPASGSEGAGGQDVAQLLGQRLNSLQRAGRLPLAGLGEREAHTLHDTVLPGLKAWQRYRSDYPRAAERHALQFTHQFPSGEPEGAPVAVTLVLDDWLEGLLLPAQDNGLQPPLWLELDPRDLVDKKDPSRPRTERLLPLYVRCVVAAACGVEMQALWVGRDASLHAQPMEPEEAQHALQALMELWYAGQNAPVPLPRRTGLARGSDDPDKAGEAYEGSFSSPGEVRDIVWARLFPDLESLDHDGQLTYWAQRIYAPLHHWCATGLQAVAWPPADGDIA